MIRSVKIEDAKYLLDIYSYYVKNTAISFEITVPTLEEFESRIKYFQSKYPYLVIEEDGKICGYAYAHEFGEREAYRYTVELSIYLDKDCKGKGYGKLLYDKLENKLKDMGIKNMYAAVVCGDSEDKYINDTSFRFHKKMGFTEIGRFHKCGNKFGNWYDIVYLEKNIGEHK